jgi:hypothetical protein
MNINNAPDFAFNGIPLESKPLPKPLCRYVADQVRELGLQIGDVIVGREGSDEDGYRPWWNENRLTLKYIGNQLCVWDLERRSDLHQTFTLKKEESNWNLTCREWYKLPTSSNTHQIPTK